jgi:CRP-like cAMP-binding protein
LLQPGLYPVDLPVRRQLETRNRRVEHVYFFEQGLASVVISAGSRHSIEIAIIGHEGMTGLPVVLEADRALYETFIQSAGHGWRIAAEDFRGAMAQSASLRTVMLRYAHTLVSQMAFTALANGRYKLEERLARWLLMANDRSDGDTIILTHEFLSIMLGARRPGVTNALNYFEKRGWLSARRGEIEIADRAALEEAANGSYGGPEAEYERLFGETPV